ncbi:imidazole glycerol phosphate synthase [Azospirillum sp. TSH7]|jgi:glutamine amidotransferase|uniref:imidazole glycerol phosphate synthase subunit HisH n=1 Tax=unclassified Azospirillum TaxID=2630922 RepID=UPI000D60A8CD|nr:MULTISPECIES: imidazole glycerol phosphate synthase subunit HisH [unclassified Azospirillum]PWC63586.1 imidazole glycerol phosphate synthase [Azospirillum sp. TSH7]PWC67953.1 imidazole glycerol phosphate synthase [Azospirillum sp. TSH20]
METVALIDYGSGNLRSAAKAIERAAGEAESSYNVLVTSDADAVRHADRVVLPGVGAFADCKRGLSEVPGMLDALEEVVHRRGRPFLGICVGMQLMAERGREYGVTEGLGWIRGEVVKLEPADPTLKIPHMGWNELNIRRPHPVLAGLPEGAHAYFVHSYQFKPADPDTLIASADYGGPFAAVVGRDNLVGTQFHPEKSQATGLALIANFLRWKV